MARGPVKGKPGKDGKSPLSDKDEMGRIVVSNREYLRLHQKDIAKEIGVSLDTVGNCERGENEGQWLWPLRLVAFYAQKSPRGRDEMLRLLGVGPEVVEVPDDLEPYWAAIREAWREPSVRDRLRASLELAFRAVGISEPEARATGPPRERSAAAGKAPARRP